MLSLIVEHLSAQRGQPPVGQLRGVQQFDRLLSLDRSDDRSDDRRGRHSSGGLIPTDNRAAREPIGQLLQGLGPQIAGVAILTRNEDPRRTLQTVDSTIHPRDTCPHTQTIQTVPRPTVIDTSDHYIHPPQQAQTDIVTNIDQERQYADCRVDLPNSFGDDSDFLSARIGICPTEKNGTGQIRRLDGIEVHDRQMSDSEQSQVLQHLVAQGTASDHHNIRTFQLLLPEPRELRKYLLSPLRTKRRNRAISPHLVNPFTVYLSKIQIIREST